MVEYKIPVMAVVGPTASGKTSLGVELCKALDGEVVSCDSMQIYKGMTIATAKPTLSEMQGITHHLIDFAEPTEIFSVAKYCEMAKEVIFDIHARGKTPVLVGGTGLYYSSLVDNIAFLDEETDFQYREKLKNRAEIEGAQALLDELNAIDPQTAAKLHANNLGRVIRALEIYHTTGKTITEQNENSKNEPSPFAFKTICLDAQNRQFLYDRINKRLDIMLDMGLVDEAKNFFKKDVSRTAVQAIGYKELKPYFDGESTLDECVEVLKMQTRRYAKRQLTWFRRDERIKFLYIDKYASKELLLNDAIKFLKGDE